MAAGNDESRERHLASLSVDELHDWHTEVDWIVRREMYLQDIDDDEHDADGLDYYYQLKCDIEGEIAKHEGDRA